MEKKPYARIEFINCDPNYKYCYCEWIDVSSQIEAAESNFSNMNEKYHEYAKENNNLPEIRITSVMLTYAEWQKAFSKYEK